METIAKYRLMGAFTLAAVVGVFGFIYWLHYGGAIGERSVYQIRFVDSVPGLRAGASVQFNGIRVGEVTDLQLDATNPKLVMATISVDRKTPIRMDTKVTLDFQGLMGVTSIALKGGSPNSPIFVSTAGSPALLVADSSAGLDLSTTARDALSRLDGILAENSDSLRGTISNLNAFTAALAKNSDRIDGIVTGLERMTGADSVRSQTSLFDLTAPTFPPNDKKFEGQIAVAEPTSLLVYDNQKLVIRRQNGSFAYIAGNGQWSDTLPNLVRTRIIQGIERAISARAVIRAADLSAGGRQLQLEIRNFELLSGEHPVANTEIAAKIVDENRLIASRTFRDEVAAPSEDAAAAAIALDQAFGKVAADIAIWTRDTFAVQP